MERPMQKLNDLSRSPSPLDPDSTLIAVIELSLSSWLVAGIVPGVERQPLKKLAVDESALLKLLHRPSCSNASFSAGCAASVITARWSQSRQLRTQMASGPTASARASSESKVGSSTGIKATL